ncbi:beta-galactosidase [Poriferisphaera sp. WC338]|uniref:beta-galactosidase n=1 Tax=Poriferisphaera sp. WC338 TaxID=3425129 RepID=UPI003D812865
MRSKRFFLGTQYYRPPFPRDGAWEQDLREIREVGIDAIVCWVVWGWCEPQEGEYVFDDYDRLFDLAAANGLEVILSVLPELNPFWMARAEPDAQIVDVMGNKAVNGPRLECLSGAVPGGCSDHPSVRKRMEDFLEACGKHFGGRSNLKAWDVWNENRWRNGVDGTVCCCEHSTKRFRGFLKEKYGGLDGLGRAWGRRYCDWEDVRLAPKQASCYPEMHDFLGWLNQRNEEMIDWRLAALKRGDDTHMVGSHTSLPSACGGVALKEDLFARGIDWDVAKGDFYGLSLFPDMTGGEPVSPIDITIRYEASASAAGNVPCLLSELQGGPTITAGRSTQPLDADRQQAWVWLAVSRGLEAAIFWCWRPEMFGLESGGFGVTSPDGFADARLKAIQSSVEKLKETGIANNGFRPLPPEVGVVFQRDSYWINWMRSREYAPGYYDAPQYTLSYLRALEALQQPYVLLDDEHIDRMDNYGKLKLVIVPDSSMLSDKVAAKLRRFAEQGGVVWVEGAPGRFGEDTFVREASEWPLLKGLNIDVRFYRASSSTSREIPARMLSNNDPLPVCFDHYEYTLSYINETDSKQEDCAIVTSLGYGKIGLVGSSISWPTWQENPERLINLVSHLLDWSAVSTPISVLNPNAHGCSVRIGWIGKNLHALAVNYSEPQTVKFKMDETIGGFSNLNLVDVDKVYSIDMKPWSYAVIKLMRGAEVMAET